MTRVLIAAAAVTLAGCLMAIRPVPFEATPAQWEVLAGRWRGEYGIADHDRHGTIEFRLKAAEREAFGDVLMVTDRAERLSGMPERDPRVSHRPGPQSQLLEIRFVAAEAGRIRGAMAPYWDDGRQCRAWATFLGSVDGNVITGSLTTVCEGGTRELRGRWRVERQR